MTADKTDTKLSRALVLTLGIGFGLNFTPTNSLAADSDDSSGIGMTRPIDIRPELPELHIPFDPIEIEPQKPSVEKKRKAYGAKFFVKEFNITGSTVFSTEELKEVTAPYENRTLFNSELEDVRIALTRKYIENGYINSGAVIPDHKVVGGVVQIFIVEGSLKDFEIKGNDFLSSDYIKERLKLGAVTPLNINDLQEQIQIMLESPVIESIKSALRPGDQPGEASLTALVKEGPRVKISPVIDNRGSPTVGDTRLLIPIQFNNPAGQGDVLNLAMGISEGLSDANMNWAFPLNPQDTTFSVAAGYSESEIINGSFKALKIKNRAQTLGFRITQPLYRSSNTKFSMSMGMDVRKSESFLLGSGFAFTSGVPADGKVQATVLRFSQDWSKRGLSEVTAARSLFSLGINANNATINSGDVPSGEFFAWLGQFQWAKLLRDDLGQFIFRSNVQLTQNPLFAMEQFSVGGALSVRGYLENQLVRDTGYNVSLEYRYPLVRDGNGKSVLTFAPFFDAGGAKNNNQSSGTDPEFISSVGFGLRWDPSKKIHAQVYWGHPLHKIEYTGNSPQENGIHFLIKADL